jgi:phytanoyl-CoA hydroxylase
MSYREYKDAFDRDGFAIVRNFLSPGEFTEVTGHIDRYIREVVPTLPDSHAFYDTKGKPDTLKQMQHMIEDTYFQAYTLHPKWLGLAEDLLGEQVHVEGPEWFNKPPGTDHITPPHQDNYYFNLKPPSVLTIWMALDPVDEENGCLRYVRGSHLRGLRPHSRSNVLGFSQGITDYGPDDEAQEAPIHLEVGDVVVHHGNTIHRANANRSATRHRRAFAMVCKGQSCQRDMEGYRRYEESLKKQHQEMGLKTAL